MDADQDDDVDIADATYLLRVLTGKYRLVGVTVTAAGPNGALVLEADLTEADGAPATAQTDVWFEVATASAADLSWLAGSEQELTEHGVVVHAVHLGDGHYLASATGFGGIEPGVGVVVVIKTTNALGETAPDRQIALNSTPWLVPGAPFDPVVTVSIGCAGAADCDDGNPCTEDACDGDPAVCSNTPIVGGCDDGDPCTEGDVCVGDTCGGTPVVCDDDDPCTSDVCAGFGCVFSELPPGTPCDDGDPCTAGDSCVAGYCEPAGPVLCDDDNVCTFDLCDAASGGCVFVPQTGTCDDGDACTWYDGCEGGECVSVPADCDDGKGCTVDTCTPEGGCAHEQLADGVLCDDGFECTEDTACLNGFCLGDLLACDDGDPCTADYCEEGTGCIHLPDEGAICDDEDVCTFMDVCVNGVCIGEPIEDCLPGPVCGDGMCIPDYETCESCPQDCSPVGGGECGAPCDPALNGNDCGPNQACVDDFEGGGVCVGAEEACDVGTQTGCEADETCAAIVGPDVGGVAYVCKPAGDLPEQAPCFLDPLACGPGLLCHQGFCLPICEPGGPACADGGCFDLIASLGGTPGVFGVCMPSCGDGTCSDDEDCQSCELDCGGCPLVCGDGLCVDPDENCLGCPEDCGVCPDVCGDGFCNLDAETCAECPADCSPVGFGVCTDPCDPALGEAACDGNYACVPFTETDAVCVGRDIACDPGQQTGCSDGEACHVIAGPDIGGYAFVCAADSLDTTGLCDPDLGACPGGACVDVGNVLGVPPGFVGECVATSSGDGTCDPFELCSCPADCGFPSGASCAGDCDPAASGQCPANHACVPTAGGIATAEAPDGGSCLGQASACGLASGAGCDPGDVCRLVAQEAFVGEALVCGAEGGAPAGSSCPMPGTCAGGAECVNGVCVTWCDPDTPGSCLGACLDASLALPVSGGLVGVCLPGACGDATCSPLEACTCAIDCGLPMDLVCGVACTPGDDSACAANEGCMGLANGLPVAPEAATDGVCIGDPTPCDPVLQSGCADGLACSLFSAAALGTDLTLCLPPTGVGTDGDDCAADPDACAAGYGCDGDVCRPWCDPGFAYCAGGWCDLAVAEVAGWCQPLDGCGDGACGDDEHCGNCPEDCGAVAGCGLACDPQAGDTSCDGNFACLPSAAGTTALAPFNSGNGVCGVPCETDDACDAGETCLAVAGLASAGLCRPACPCDPADTCVDGACVPSTGCDPGYDQSCDPAGLGTCLALSGDVADTTCLGGCFVQGGAACDAGSTCLARADAAWHAGLCLGQPTPCDEVAQTGCGASETCFVAGGLAYGGQAWVCVPAPGSTGQGGDCSTDPTACAPGLVCQGGTCASYCDPDGGAPCCVDISAELYLPAGSVGVCP